jgi:hypothetical protein
VRLWKFAARPKFSGSRHYAKPLGRCVQANDSAVNKVADNARKILKIS